MCASWSGNKADRPRWRARSLDTSPEWPDCMAPPFILAPGLPSQAVLLQALELNRARAGPLEPGALLPAA